MTTKNKKIITFNAIILMLQNNPELSLRECCFKFYQNAYSKRIKTGFNNCSPQSFYDSVRKFHKLNFRTPDNFNFNNLKEFLEL